MYRRQWTKPSQRKRKAKGQSGHPRRFHKQLKKEKKQKARGKGNVHPTKCRVPKNSKERQKGLLQHTVHKNRGKQQGPKD